MPKLNLKEATGVGPDSIGAPTIDAFDTINKPGGRRNAAEDEEEVVMNISQDMGRTDSPTVSVNMTQTGRPSADEGNDVRELRNMLERAHLGSQGLPSSNYSQSGAGHMQEQQPPQ